MRTRQYCISKKAIAATNVLARTELGANIGDFPRQGRLAKIVFHITVIAGSTQFSKLTLGTVDGDHRYLITSSSGAWEADAADATKATLCLYIDEPFVITDDHLDDTTNYDGLFLGHQLDAGTATVDADLFIEA